MSISPNKTGLYGYLKKCKSINLLFLSILCFSTPLFAVATYTKGHTAAELAAKIEGNGITITNAVIRRGDTDQTAIFEDGVTGAGLDIDEGILLTCMDADNAFEENENTGQSTDNPDITPDSDLTAIDPNAVYDTVVLEFDVTLDENTHLLLINYQFASDEYNEYVGSVYNDAFGFFISGGDLNQTYNIARVVDPQTFTTVDNLANFPPVTVNNVNNGTLGALADGTPTDLTNSQYFIDNDDQSGGAPVEVEFDGLTVGLNATLDNLTPGETYHFKMALADTGDSAWDTGVFVNSIQGIRSPQICYDYAYKQNNRFFTESYGDSDGPHIVGDVVAGTPVEVSLYIKNQEDSEVPATNVKVNIQDLNSSQVTYISDSVYVTDPGATAPRNIPDGTEGMTATTTSISNIPIEDVDSLDYFFTSYSLDPAVDTLNTPINALVSYTLRIELSSTQSIDINRTGVIDEDTPLCLAGGSQYVVQDGIFNVEHASLYGSQKYNLPTQVARRPDNFKIVSYSENDFNQRADLNTSVFVELIDAGGFQDISAACNNPDSALTERVAVHMANGVADFDETVIINNSLDATKTVEDFFGNARESTAFRVSYNYLADENESLVDTRSDGSGGWYVDNFNELAAGVVGANLELGLPVNEQNKCREDVVVLSYLPNGNIKTETFTTMPQACGNASDTNSITARELATCMQCIFGFNTKRICARDNFATRPESLKVSIFDNQESTTDTDPKIEVPNEGKISAGYNYRYDVNATSHTDNNAVPGYTRYYGMSNLSDHNITYYWRPLTTLGGCNDTTDKYPSIRIIDGEAVNNQNRSNNVGRYELEMRDIGWTKADQSPPHHTTNYFLSGNDCDITSSSTPAAGTQLTRGTVGCITSSNNVNADNTALNTEDYNITVRPYDLNISSVTLNKGISNTPIVGNDYVYYNNVSNDANMSVRYSGQIRAVGANSVPLSNFVSDCYAEDITLELNTSALPATPLFKYRLLETNASNGLIFSDTEGNNAGATTLDPVDINSTNFLPSSFGLSDMALNVNFDRNVTGAINPLTITYNSFNVSCKTPLNCESYADMSPNHLPDSNITSLIPVTHIYGRQHVPRHRSPTATALVPIYYEFYCDSLTGCNIGSHAANPALSPNALLSPDDVRWYIQSMHDVNIDGNATSTQARNAADNAQFPGATNMDINSTADGATYTYSGGKGYPYKVTMEVTVPDWLVYNRYDATADVNTFELEFSTTGQMVGQDGSLMQVDSNASAVTNRRIEW